MQDYFYQILYGAMNTLLDETIRRDGLSAWPQSDARNRFNRQPRCLHRPDCVSRAGAVAAGGL